MLAPHCFGAAGWARERDTSRRAWLTHQACTRSVDVTSAEARRGATSSQRRQRRRAMQAGSLKFRLRMVWCRRQLTPLRKARFLLWGAAQSFVDPGLTAWPAY
jgi:hypothetical protein